MILKFQLKDFRQAVAPSVLKKHDSRNKEKDKDSSTMERLSMFKERGERSI